MIAGLVLSLAAAHAAPRGQIKRIGDHLARVVKDGDTSLYLSGYAYHSDRTYDPDLKRFLNSEAYGGGIGRTLRLANDGLASIGFTAFLDSLGAWEYNLAYVREWRWVPRGGRLALGAGLSAFLTSRQDFFDGVPFPAVLPQLSVEHRNVALIATLIPRIPSVAGPNGLSGMNGDVIYTYMRITLR